MVDATKLAIRYTIFALIATSANVGAQDIFIQIYSGPNHIFVSVLVGTVVGLFVKYALDKRYIFRFRALSFYHETRTFVLYAIMGLILTMVFWGFEFGFQLIFGTKGMRYFGGSLGLAIGYLIKYQLDKRYVFLQGKS